MSVLSWEYLQVSIYRLNPLRGRSLRFLFRIGSLAFSWIFWATKEWEEEQVSNKMWGQNSAWFIPTPSPIAVTGTDLDLTFTARHCVYVGINQAGFGPAATLYPKLQILKIVTFLQVKIQQKQDLTKYKPFINKNLWLDQYFK